MQEERYKLSFLPLFEQDLNEIIDYISIDLNNPKAARKLVDDIEKAILKRLETPLMYAPYESNKARKYPYYKIKVKNFLIFYVVIDDTMEVRRILYSRRNIDSLI